MLSIIFEAGFKLLVVFNRDFISLFMHIDIKVLIMIKKNVFIVKMVFDFRHSVQNLFYQWPNKEMKSMWSSDSEIYDICKS